MSLPTPNYRLISDYELRIGGRDFTTLPAGAYVRPIEPCYLPAHVIEFYEAHGYTLKEYVYCYTRNGIVPINKTNLRGE